MVPATGMSVQTVSERIPEKNVLLGKQSLFSVSGYIYMYIHSYIYVYT